VTKTANPLCEFGRDLSLYYSYWLELQVIYSIMHSFNRRCANGITKGQFARVKVLSWYLVQFLLNLIKGEQHWQFSSFLAKIRVNNLNSRDLVFNSFLNYVVYKYIFIIYLFMLMNARRVFFHYHSKLPTVAKIRVLVLSVLNSMFRSGLVDT
jgi:hypothetical protein